MAKAKFDELMADLKKGQYAPLYLLHGEESYFIDLITDHIADSALSESEKVFNQIIAYGKETNSKTVIDNARQYPMMAQRRVVIVKEAQMMRDIKNLEVYAANPAEATVLVLSHPHKKLDGRSGLYKAISKHGVIFESAPLRDYQMPKWIAAYMKQRKYSISPEAVQVLVEYLGSDLGKVVNEIDKLTITLGDRRDVTKEDVYENIGISKDFNVFELQKALGTRDILAIQRIVDYFVSNMKNNPLVMVNALLYTYFTKVFIVKTMTRASDREMASAIGGSPYFVKEYRAAAANYSVNHLRHILGILKDYDLRSKGFGSRSTGDAELLREMIQKIYTLPLRMR